MKRQAGLILMLFFSVVLRGQQLFNNDWRFHKGDIAGGETGGGDSVKWRTVELPHDWSIEGPFSKEWASATAYLPGGIGWYMKTFSTSPEWKSKKVFIYFDGVYMNSTVWLNGHFLGHRPNGFIAFEYDLTPFLNFSGPNVLKVKVDHSDFADSRWYTGSGIYRNVYLHVKEPVHIAKWGVQFSTPEVTTAKATAVVRVAVINQGVQKEKLTISAILKSAGGKVIAKTDGLLPIAAGDSLRKDLSLTVSSPALWSTATPTLYTLEVSVVSGTRQLDTYIEKVGIRKTGLNADRGFSINGQPLKLKGICLHDDAGVFGVAVPEAVWRRRLQLLKDAGVNSIRMSHNPHADYMYRLCDEMGFLVLDEAFDEWEEGKNKWIEGWNVGKPGKGGYHEYFTTWAAADVRDMILRSYNHPSIIAWSIGNEIDYPNDPYSDEVLNSGNNPQIFGKGYLPDHPKASRLGELSRQLAAEVRRYDSTRPVTAALAGVVMSNTTTYPDNLDWVGYNYQEYRYAEDHKKYPQRIIYGSENGMQLNAWNAVDSNDFISAQYLWTGVDYLGEAGRWPVRSNRAGLIDLAGFPKTEYYFRQSLWSNTPMIYIGSGRVPKDTDRGIWAHKRSTPNWNWNANDKVRISCFSNCSEAELIINGRSLGKKSVAGFKDRVVFWDIDYEPGELKAIGYNDGKAVADALLKTAGAPYAVKALVEYDAAGKTGLDHLIVTIVDKEGNYVYDAAHEVTVTLSSGAVLLGLESGSDNSHEDYQANRRQVLHGKLMAYVWQEKNAASAAVTVSAEGLKPATIQLSNK